MTMVQKTLLALLQLAVLAGMQVSTTLSRHALFYRGSQPDKFSLLCREDQVLKVLEGMQYEQTGQLDLLFVNDMSSLVDFRLSGKSLTATVPRARLLAIVQSAIVHFTVDGAHKKDGYIGFTLSCPDKVVEDCTFSVILQPGLTLNASRYQPRHWIYFYL